MRFLIGSSLRLRFLVIVLTAAFLLFGWGQLRQMPVDVYPEFDPPLVEVQTEALGLSAAEVEALITVPLEADLLNGVAWLEEIHSQSVAGLSSILLVFEPGTDPIAARQMVQERLTQTFALPNVSKPPTMLQPLSSFSRVMMVGLTSEELSLIEMGVLARWNIKPRLMGVPGVANVAIWGQRERQLQVLVDPKKLRANGVTLAQVIETTGEALWFSPLSYLKSSTPGTAGWIDTPNQRLTIRHELPITSAEDLAKVAVVGRPGLLLGEVAKVVEEHQPLIGNAILDNGSGLLLVIEKFPAANTLSVTRGVEAALSAMRPGLAGIEIDTTVFRPANFLEQAIGNLSRLVVIGLVLTALALMAFYRHWRVLVSLVTIPLSLLAAVLVLYAAGQTFNMMILTGLTAALILVIDDAILDVEKMAGWQKGRPNLILAAVVKIRRPIVFATLIILLTVLPLFFIEGLARAFFQPLVVAYVLATLASFLVVLTVTPALSLMLPAKARSVAKSPPALFRLEQAYDRLIAVALKKPGKVLSIGLAVVLIATASLPLLKMSLAPALKQTDILIEWEAVPGTSLPEMNRMAVQVSGELKTIEGVENVGVHVGRAVTGDAVVGINSAQLWVNLAPEANYDKTLVAIRQVVAGYPGVFQEVTAYQPERLDEALLGESKDLVVRVYGTDLNVLKDLSDQIKAILAGIEGVVEAKADFPLEEPQVEIEVDLAKAEVNQVKPGDVRRQATTLLSGLQVGNLYQEQKIFDVVVWGEPEIRNSLTDIESLVIETPRGQVPLAELAEVRLEPAPLTIKREAVSRYLDVEVKVSGRSMASITADIESRLKTIEFPLEYHAEVLGASQNKINGPRLLLIAIASLIGIYLLLQAAFSSWRTAALAFLGLPLALSGGVLAANLSGGIVSIGTLVGLLAIAGISFRYTLTLINHFQELEKKGLRLGPALVRRGVGNRFKPIVATTAVATLALLPAVLAGPMAGNELLHPLAMVILGGLATTTFLHLFLVPVLYLRYADTALKET